MVKEGVVMGLQFSILSLVFLWKGIECDSMLMIMVAIACAIYSPIAPHSLGSLFSSEKGKEKEEKSDDSAAIDSKVRKARISS